MSSLSRLLRYGNWSGPGWSNGDNYGGRVLSDPELRTPGIDAYDNYVAKVHDLNEIFAAFDLRNALAAASPAHQDLLLRKPAGDFIVPLVFVPASELMSAPRVVGVDHYMNGVGTHERQRIGEAFFSYFNHVMRSDLQFAIDYVHNEVSIFKPRGFAMQAQLMAGASHIFLAEAGWLEGQLTALRQKGHVSDSYISSVPAALRMRFVKPGFANARSQYVSSVGRRYIDKVGIETLMVADRHSLLNRAVEIRRAK